jgi:hypothetical protein
MEKSEAAESSREVLIEPASLASLVKRGDEGIERRVASSPSPQQPHGSTASPLEWRAVVGSACKRGSPRPSLAGDPRALVEVRVPSVMAQTHGSIGPHLAGGPYGTRRCLGLSHRGSTQGCSRGVLLLWGHEAASGPLCRVSSEPMQKSGSHPWGSKLMVEVAKQSLLGVVVTPT